MAQRCWICGFNVNYKESENTVFTKGGIVHDYYLELYPTEVSDEYVALAIPLTMEGQVRQVED